MNIPIDLSEFILNAKKMINSKLYIVELKKFATAHFYTLDWDSEDGEEWGRIIIDGNKILIFNATLPIVFCKIDFYNEINKWLSLTSVQVQLLTLKSWADDNYIISSELAKDLIGWTSYQLNTRFSINDLWFHTI